MRFPFLNCRIERGVLRQIDEVLGGCRLQRQRLDAGERALHDRRLGASEELQGGFSRSGLLAIETDESLDRFGAAPGGNGRDVAPESRETLACACQKLDLAASGGRQALRTRVPFG